MGRHARYFLDLTERADNQYWAGDEARALSSIESDHDNVRAALRHFLASGDGESAARLAGGLGMFWFIHGQCGEGRAWLREVLSQLHAHRQRQVCCTLTGTMRSPSCAAK